MAGHQMKIDCDFPIYGVKHQRKTLVVESTEPPGDTSSEEDVTDRLSPEQRSRNMSRIRGRNTAPEMTVRRLLHGLGFRYRLHVSGLPGRPDIVFPGRRKDGVFAIRPP